MYLVDPLTGEEEQISFTANFNSDQGMIEVLGKTLIFSDHNSLTLVDLK